MRTILFGAGGQLGVDLARLCRKRGHRLLALRRSQLDITDDSAIRQRIARHRPDCVINAAAYNQVDQAEGDIETALRVNALAVRNIAAACGEVGAVLVHYSTDYVFDGEKGSPYKETDDAAPQSVYGLSKLMGETFVEVHCPSHYVLRVAGVFGPPGRHTERGNFAEFVLRKCAEGAPLRIVDDQVATPTFGPALAARTLTRSSIRFRSVCITWPVASRFRGTSSPARSCAWRAAPASWNRSTGRATKRRPAGRDTRHSRTRRPKRPESPRCPALTLRSQSI